jgi:hypothetical protein
MSTTITAAGCALLTSKLVELFSALRLLAAFATLAITVVALIEATATAGAILLNNTGLAATALVALVTV